MTKPIAALAAMALALGVQRGQAPVPQVPPHVTTGPHLVVFVVIDQFRADYVTMYGQQWTKGLRRLVDSGAVFANAAYPYAATYTCAGHATISTGAFPAVHGMSGNVFYDRALRRSVSCAYDPDVTPVAFAGGTGREHHGPRSLLVPTFGDELRRQSPVRPPQIVAVGQKPRTAITLGGHAAPTTVAVWEEDDGTWATSDTFSKTPWTDVDAYVRAHPIKDAYGESWTLLLPPSAYKFTDEAPGENRPAPWGRTFPHQLISSKGQPDNEFVTAWERSPRDDEFLTGLAMHLLKSRRLGTGAGNDVLAISLPCLDLNGHEYGPRSFEVQDVLARLDVNIGRLLDAIEQQVGKDYVLGLSSDHGVATLPEQITAEGGDAGRISGTTIRNAVNLAVEQSLGEPGPYVASVYEQQIALNPGVFDRLRLTAGGLQAVKTTLGKIDGIAAAYSADDIVGGANATDAGIKAWRLSYVAGRSGDFLVTPKLNWIIHPTAGSDHGTLNEYDQRVPLILYGSGIRSGRYDQAVTPADMAPTFAAMTGITLPRAQGRALAEALDRK